jgi:RHS repeat-associated protein
LSYLNARYYDGSRGQFMSVNPVFLGNPSQQKLDDPQSLNAYAYADDNPTNKKDPTGLTTSPAQALTWVSIFTEGRELRIKLEVD